MLDKTGYRMCEDGMQEEGPREVSLAEQDIVPGPQPQQPQRGRPRGPHDPIANPPKFQVKKVSWWHERMIDWMLLNPGKTKKDMAEYFNKDPQTIYVITNSEVFKQRYEQASQMVGDRVMADAKERLDAVACGSLGEIARRLNETPDKIPTRELRELADMSLQNLGYGSRQGGVTAVFANNTTQFVSVPQDVLARSRAALLDKGAPVRTTGPTGSEADTLPAFGSSADRYMQGAIIEGDALVEDKSIDDAEAAEAEGLQTCGGD